MAKAKTFVLGLGVQKSATSWLFQYLSGVPFADFGFSKEYHVWDFARRDQGPDKSPVALGPRQILQSRLTKDIKAKVPKRTILRMAFLEHPEFYFAYFNDLLSRGNATLTGDITPTYSGLSQAELTIVRDEFANRSITVKPILLLRDPVYRALSAARMKLSTEARAAGAKPKSWTAAHEIAMLEKMVGSENDLVRASYDRTIENGQAVFGPEGIFIRLYEDLFNEHITTDLSSFLNCDLPPAPIDTVQFSLATEHILPEADYMRFRAHYAPMIARTGELTGFDVEKRWAFRPNG